MKLGKWPKQLIRTAPYIHTYICSVPNESRRHCRNIIQFIVSIRARLDSLRIPYTWCATIILHHAAGCTISLLFSYFQWGDTTFPKKSISSTEVTWPKKISRHFPESVTDGPFPRHALGSFVRKIFCFSKVFVDRNNNTNFPNFFISLKKVDLKKKHYYISCKKVFCFIQPLEALSCFWGFFQLSRKLCPCVPIGDSFHT